MTLIKSISGIRGTIGGDIGNSLTPNDVVSFAAAYAVWIKSKNFNNTVIIGRDARVSGEMISNLVCSTLQLSGIDVIDIGLSTTPTVEISVLENNYSGGIIITASHNPGNWNALKLLNSSGEFISASDGNEILKIASNKTFDYVDVSLLGKYKLDENFNDFHIDKILDLDLVNKEAIKKAKLNVVIDAVNSTGGFMIPKLLEKLGVSYHKLYCEPNGIFPHNPEPLVENLSEISTQVVNNGSHLGLVVDPDVDRLAIVCEDGSMFGEEYTLVSVADYILSKKRGSTVSNLSSTRALKDITEKYACNYFPSAVGEVNVVECMKINNAVIGGEGNGGVILPDLHYGRDALVGIALFLSLYAEKGLKASVLRDSYPKYYMKKNKVELDDENKIQNVFDYLLLEYDYAHINKIDGVKFDFENGWVHVRRSNTEPIIRIYSEFNNKADLEKFSKEFFTKINTF
ncbi:phosphoglucosamine mutase [Bacteroidota bacterium]|nr:phosphoglucosamine mutase [Bacteroidota bacterium]